MRVLIDARRPCVTQHICLVLVINQRPSLRHSPAARRATCGVRRLLCRRRVTAAAMPRAQADVGALDAAAEAVGAALQQLRTPHARRVARLA